VLLDEPFASLDAGLRATLREQVAAILRAAGASALLVTHDQQEALSLADTVVVMREGRVEQADTPEALYARPATRWIAEFLGAAEVLPGTAAGGVAVCELGRFPADPDLQGAVEVVVRPEAVAITGPGAPGRDGGADAHVVGRTFYGHDQLVRLELASGRRLQIRTTGHLRHQPGDAVGLRVDGDVTVLPASPPTPPPTHAPSPAPSR
jgi:iron(III) transport system ATP-binding protein